MSSTAAFDSKKPTTKQELIAANIRLLIEQLEAGKSGALTHYLTAMSRFHNHSFGNVLEIARPMPTATRVAGFWAWKNLGRNVNAGADYIQLYHGKAAESLASAVTQAQRGSNLRVVDKLDALRLDERSETLDAFAGVARGAPTCSTSRRPMVLTFQRWSALHGAGHRDDR